MAVTCADCGRTFSSDDAFDEHGCAGGGDEGEGGLPFETPEEFADPHPFQPDEARVDEPANLEEDVTVDRETSNSSTIWKTSTI